MLNARSLNKKALYIPYDSIIIKIRTGKTNLWWKKNDGCLWEVGEGIDWEEA